MELVKSYLYVANWKGRKPSFLVSTSSKKNPGWTLEFFLIMQEGLAFHVEGRKVAIIIDNCLAHPNVDNLKAIELVFYHPTQPEPWSN